jgi:cold-inducible RNA-binding protein
VDTKLYVGNLSPVTTAEDLRMLFNTAGGVISVQLIKDKSTGKSKGFAFVEMVSQGDAGKAVSEFNGYRLDRNRLKVMVAKTNGQRPNRVAGYTEYISYNESIAKPYFKNRRS